MPGQDRARVIVMIVCRGRSAARESRRCHINPCETCWGSRRQTETIPAAQRDDRVTLERVGTAPGLTGDQVVAGSNPVSPTEVYAGDHMFWSESSEGRAISHRSFTGICQHSPALEA